MRRPRRARQCICMNWRRRGVERLAVPDITGVVPLALGDGLDAESSGGARVRRLQRWAMTRLSARLVASAHHLAQHPLRAITGATARSTLHWLKGHYRLIDSAGRQRGNGREHTQAASAADPAPDERPPDGAVYTGRHPAELHATRPDAGTGRDRQQPDWRRGPRAAPAHDAGGQPRGGASLGHPAGWLRRSHGPRPRRRPAPGQSTAPKAARGAQVVSLDRGSARSVHKRASNWPDDARAVHPGPRGRSSLDLFVERREHAPQVELLVRAKVDRVLAKERTADGDSDHAPPVRGGA